MDLSKADIDGITATVRDYYEGWYAADPERMRRALHPRLAKRHVEPGTDGSWTIEDLSRDVMVDATARRTPQVPLPPYEVLVRDGHGCSAVARGSSADFLDYLQLGKFGDRWQILNVMWENLR